MTMFSMKPKFDLAAFLAEPAKPSTSRRRNAFKPSRPVEPAEEAIEDEPAAPTTPATRSA